MKTEETTLDKIRTRPRFRMITELDPSDYELNLKQYLSTQKDFEGNINREVATIKIITDENPFWKPTLSLRTSKEEEHTVIRGVFGPSSAVWTFFMFLYFVFSILWMVFITLWFVGKQIKSNEYNWGLSASLLMLLMIGLTYLAARIGQKKAKSEMELLRNFVIQSTLKFEKTIQ